MLLARATSPHSASHSPPPHLQLGYGQQLRDRSKRTHRQPHQDREQRLLHPLEHIQQPYYRPVCQISSFPISASPWLGPSTSRRKSRSPSPSRWNWPGDIPRRATTRDSKLSGDRNQSRGDGGQMPSPGKRRRSSASPTQTFTLSVGWNTSSRLLDHDSFVRFDYQFQRPAEVARPLSGREFAAITIPPTTSCRPQFCLRAGRHQLRQECSFPAFCDNLFDTPPP